MPTTFLEPGLPVTAISASCQNERGSPHDISNKCCTIDRTIVEAGSCVANMVEGSNESRVFQDPMTAGYEWLASSEQPAPSGPGNGRLKVAK
jgi:hypothetical protein